MRYENKDELATQYLRQSLRLAQALGYPGDIRNAAENLQLMYRKKNDWKSALLMNDLYIRMRDSVLNENSRKSTLKAQLSYEYELKETAYKSEQEKKDTIAKAKIASQKLIRNVFIIGFVLVLLFALYILKQHQRISKKNNAVTSCC